MTGLELLEGLSFVDEKFIAEAETAKLGRNIPWMKVLSVAACLCILMVGAFALKGFGHKGAMEDMFEAAADAPAAAAPMEDAPAADAPAADMPAEAAPVEPESSAQEAAAEKEPSLYGVSYAKLQIVNVVGEGEYEGIVEAANTDLDIFEEGIQVNLVIAPDKVPQTDRVDADYAEDITVDMVVEIQSGIYDVDTGVLYVAGLLPGE